MTFLVDLERTTFDLSKYQNVNIELVCKLGLQTKFKDLMSSTPGYKVFLFFYFFIFFIFLCEVHKRQSGPEAQHHTNL